MKSLEMRHLRNLCDKHEIDYALIDDTLTYYENLKELGLRDIDAEVSDFWNTPLSRNQQKHFDGLFEKYDQTTSLHIRYGISDEELERLEIPFCVWRWYCKVPYYLSARLKRQLKPFKSVTWVNKWYFVIEGTRLEILEVMNRLPRSAQNFRRDKVWERDVKFLAGKWRRLPEIGVPLKVVYN